jgi:DNA-binding Lrp family transcriptional regulator
MILTSYILIKTTPGFEEEVKQRLLKMPYVFMIELTSGDYDIMATIKVTNLKKLVYLANEKIPALPNVTKVLVLLSRGPV